MNDVRIDKASLRFVKAMEIFTNIGLVIMVVSGIWYFAGLSQCADPQAVVRNWHLPASEFWSETQHIDANGYSWFLGDLDCAANVSVLGISILLLAPLVSILAVLPLSGGIYVVFYFVLIVEFVFAVIRPLLSRVTGQ